MSEKTETEKLTPEQIRNWRKVLVGMFGTYALLMSDAEVQEFRNTMQAHVGDLKTP